MWNSNITDKLIYTLVAVLVAEGVRQLGKLAISSALNKLANTRAKTVGSVLKNSLSFVVWGMAVAMILKQWGWDISPLIAGAGVVGVAVGFGSQALVRDVMSGLFMLAENHVGVGDLVEVAGKKGRVVSVKLRTVIIKDDKTGDTHIIPNSLVGVVTKFKE